MTDQQHPITPPQELVREWARPGSLNGRDLYIADQAARWGADQQLKQDAKWLDINAIRQAMRPKPPSLKERLSKAIVEGDERQALKLLEELDDFLEHSQHHPPRTGGAF